MRGLSEHTMLMNMLIGFVKGRADWPTPLKNLGFKIDWLEAKFENQNGEKVNPDIVMSSNRLSITMLSECKGGKSVNLDQVRRYANVNANDIKSLSSLNDKNKIKCEIHYAFNEDNTSTFTQISAIKPFPILVLKDKITLVNNFQDKTIDKEFSSSIKISINPPLGFYPFSHDDDIAYIGMKVLQHVISLVIKKQYKDDIEFSNDEIGRGIHKFWDNIQTKEKALIKEKINRIMSRIKDMVPLDKSRDGVNWRVLNSKDFIEKCQKLIESITEEKKEKSLFEFAE